jgi:hypothetical protein
MPNHFFDRIEVSGKDGINTRHGLRRIEKNHPRSGYAFDGTPAVRRAFVTRTLTKNQ